MNKSNLIYRDDREYLDDMFTYLELCLKEPLGTKTEEFYNVILQRLEMNQVAESLPRMERLLESVPLESAKGFLRKFLTLLIKRKLNPSFFDEKDSSPSLSNYMDLLWDHDSESSFEVGRYADYLYIKDFIELIFPELHDVSDLLNTPIEADIRLVDYLIGSDTYVPPYTKIALTSTNSPLFFLDEIILQEQEIISANKSRALLWGESGGGKKSSLLQAALEKNRPVIYFFIPKDNKDNNLYKALCYAQRETFFYHGVLAICGMENVSNESDFLLAFEETPQELIPNIFFLMDTDKEPEQSSFLRIKIGDYDDGNRQKLWENFLAEDFADYEIENGLDLDVLASTFLITPGQMKKALEDATRCKDKIITKKSLYEACYGQLGHILSDKASRIVTTMTFDDIKLGDANMEYLKDIRNSILSRYEVHYKWNFKKKLPYGEGMSIVFSGPPGTGKTMAAGVLANELGMEIYRIDLSQLMDKYVGETEKNIKSIFTSASKMSCILFFDEADAIFNKRMDAQGANERFANIESALLLQCIEEYKGISILCTNDMGRIDGAFMRRFKYHIIFKNPDNEIRLEIWKGVFPKEAPLKKDVDFELLANVFDISGALIKNIALSSAYLAACDGKEIGMKEIMKAAVRELEKNKMIISPEASNCIHTFLD